MEDDMEQRMHDFETAQATLVSQVKTKSDRIQELEASATELQGRLDETLADLEREKSGRLSAQKKADERVTAFEERESALRTVDELRRQAKRQEESYDTLEAELHKVQAKLREAEQNCGDARDDVQTKEREMATVNRRAASLQSQCLDLERELDGRTKGLAEYRGQKSAELIEKVSELTVMTRRFEDQATKLAAAQKNTEALEGRLGRCEGDLAAVLDKSAADKDALEKQISLQETLTHLQKDRADEASRKIDSIQREVRSLESKVASERDRTVQERKRADSIRDKSKAVVQEMKAKLLEEETKAKRAGESAKAAAENGRSSGGPMEAEPVPLDLSVDLDSLNDTELKMRVMRMERELEYVRSDRDRNELYLQRILREVDQKSPLLMSNKRDYQRVLQSHEQLFLKVEDSMRRCQKAELERGDAASRRDYLEEELEAAKDSLADLGTQVQKLLSDKLERDLGRPLVRGGGGARSAKSAAGETAMVVAGGNVVAQEPDQVIADHLVTFEDVREMQERNRTLVQVVRRMTVELKDCKVSRRKLEQATIDEKMVTELHRQLEDLKESRDRQNDMLKAVTEARDMYRVLLAQETSKDMSASRRDGTSSSGEGASTAAAQQETEAMKSRVHELERDLGVARDESAKLQKSLRLMGDEVTTAERAAGRAVSELAATQRMLSHSEDQVNVLTEDRKARNTTIELGASKFATLSDNVVKLQDLLERQKNAAYAAEDKAKDLQLTIMGLNADKRIIAAAERSLREENARLQKAADFKGSLLDNAAQRDRTLVAQRDAEMSTLREELARLRRVSEDDRRRAAAAEMDREKASSASRELRQSLERDLAAEKVQAKTATDAASAAADAQKNASDRVLELTARLQEARARVLTSGCEVGGVAGAAAADGGGGGGGGTKDGMSSQLAAVGKLQLELQATRAELKAKTEAVATNERQRLQYEAMAKSKQQQLDQLTLSSKKTKEELEAREQVALKRAETAEAEVRATKTGLASTVADMLKEKDLAEKESLAQKQLVLRLKDELEVSLKDAKQGRGSTAEVKVELETQQKAARDAEERYRKELEAHVGAITALRQAEDAQDECNKAKRDAEHAKVSLAADLMRARAQWAASEEQLKKACEDADARLDAVNTQNEVLHSHLQTLTQQLEAQREKREADDKAVADKQLALGEGEGGADAEYDEKMKLAKSVKELTELLRFNRRDKQLAETNLEMMQQRVSKAEAELERTKQSLREAREDVQKAARENMDAVSKQEHQKLVVEVRQLSALRESNTILRSSLREAEGRTRDAVERANGLELKTAPLQQKEREQAAAKASLESQNESLMREVESWKKRVTSLTASFNAIDPKDHEEVVAEKNKLAQALANSEKAKGVLESGKAELSKRVAAVQKEKDDAVTSRNKMGAQALELKKTLDRVRGEANALKAAATRDLEAKMTAEKEKASKAASDLQAARLEAARQRASVHHSHGAAMKQLTDQANKAKAEADALRVQLRQNLPKDNALQLDALRKEVASLEATVVEKDRENETHRGMYGNMKIVSRKIKESLAAKEKEYAALAAETETLRVRVAELEGKAPPPKRVSPTPPDRNASESSSASTTVTVAASAATGSDAVAARQTRPVSPALAVTREASPARAAASTLPMSDAVGAGGMGDDGGEALLKNKLMARSKRPLASTSEASGPSKRVHKPSDQTASFAGTPVVSAVVTSAAGAGAGPTATSVGSTPTSTPATAAVASSSASSSTAMAGSTASALFGTSTAPSTPAAGLSASGSGAFATPTTATSTSPPSVGIVGSSSALNPAARPFANLSGRTWDGPRGAAGGGGGTGAAAPPSFSALGRSSAASSVGGFGVMTWGSGTPAESVSATAAASASSVMPALGTGGSTTAPAASNVTTASDGVAGVGGVSGVMGSGLGGGVLSGAGAGAGVSKAPAMAPSAGSGVFGTGKGFAMGGIFGSDNVASMKPPSSGAEFPKFPSVALPVPSSASGVQPSSGATFTPASAAASAAASTFGIPTPINTFRGVASASGGDSMNFGLGPVATAADGKPASFDAAVPIFGRPMAPAGVVSAAAVAPVPSPLAVVTAFPSVVGGAATTQGAAGGVGGGEQVVVDGTDVAAAAAGVPGPGALMLDVEARRAARQKRFLSHGAPGHAPSNEAGAPADQQMAAAATPQQATSPKAKQAVPDSAAKSAGQSQQQEQQDQEEEGEIDEDDESDAL